MARLRPGVPMMYSKMPKGSKPYNTKVITAPSTVPLLAVASATAIIKVTYNQAMATMYMVSELVIIFSEFVRFSNASAEILRVYCSDTNQRITNE